MDAKINYLFFIVFTFLLASCATLDKAALRQLQPSPIQDLALQPAFDLYDIRLDIIRQKDAGDSTAIEENRPYRTLGFKLGNGLFFDLNRNISLLVPEMLGLEGTENFLIEEHNRRGRIISEYQREPEAYTVKVHALIPWTQKAQLEFSDTSLAVRRGLMGRYTLSWTDSTLQHKGFLESNTIVPVEGGFMIPKLLARRKYLQDGQTITLDNRYRVARQGNTIFISQKYLIGGWQRRHTMVRSENVTFVYDRYKRGMKITLLDDELIVEQNRRLYKKYVNKNSL